MLALNRNSMGFGFWPISPSMSSPCAARLMRVINKKSIAAQAALAA
jgi:hypothetical protein